MSLVQEAITLLTTGFDLRATSAKDLQSPVSLGEAQGAFIIQTADDQQRFSHATHAVMRFRRLVGRAGLSNAVGEVRYQAMFPQGSSLGWPPIPVRTLPRSS